MSETIIKVENLSKRYRIGAKEQGYKTFREALIDGLTAPIRNFKRLRKLTKFDDNPSKEPNTELRAPCPLPSSQSDDTIWALRDVSFEVNQGEVVGIIGRNGAGKTTLLKILSRITEPTSGEVKLYGRVSSLLEVGTGFHPELTGRENIYLNGAILGMKKKEIDRKFDEIVDFAEIERFIDTPVKRYSSGMYVRLAFAVAAHLEPEILLVDEVLAVGDSAFQKKCLGKMGDIAKEGRTVLFVSHNMAAVRKLCSHAMLLESGRKEKAGSVDSVISHYLAEGASELSAIVALPPGLPDAPGVGTCLRFFAHDGTPQAQFRLGETWRIVLEFEMLRATPHVVAAVGLVNFDSVGIITYWSNPKNLRPGRYGVEFECGVPLKACDIQFAVGLSSNERTFYYVQGVGHVSVSEIAQGEQPFRASGAGLLLSAQQSEIEVIEPISGYSTQISQVLPG